MMKDANSQRTHAIGQLQADLALALPSYACDDESLLSGSIDVLKGVSDRLFDRVQEVIAADEKVVDGARHGPVDVADSINGF